MIIIKLFKKIIFYIFFKPFLNKFTYKYFPRLFLFVRFFNVDNVNTQDYWNKTHEQESKSQTTRFETKVVNLLKYIDFSNKDILDVGCGRGYFLSTIPQARSRTGVDISSSAVAMLQDKGIDAYECTLPHLSLGDKSFDTITCFETLEHVRNWKQSIVEMITYLREGGYLIISVPFEDKILMNEHVNYFDVNRIYGVLKKHINVLEIKILGPWLLVVAKKSSISSNEIDRYYQ